MLLKPQSLFLLFALICSMPLLADGDGSSSTSSSPNSKKASPTTLNAIQSRALAEQFEDSDSTDCKEDEVSKGGSCIPAPSTGAGGTAKKNPKDASG